MANVDAAELDPITLGELKLAVAALPNDSSAGPTRIHNKMLKRLPDKVLQSIVTLANITLQQGKLPNAWKSARVTMIPKGKSASSDPSSYRPISVTCCLGKLVERVLHKRMYAMLENAGFFARCHSGFRSRRRTSDNLFYLTQKIKENMCRKKRVCCLFFDIRKAFDGVWHKGLIHKMILAKLPVTLIRWTKDFLEERTFNLLVGKELSEAGRITAGVPQGSVLSPLLFNIFINDAPCGSFKNKRHSLLFADDLATLFIYKRQGHLTRRVQLYLDQLSKWLHMNTSKCSYTIFANGNPDTKFSFQLSGSSIQHEAHPKLLGTTFDQRLSFNINDDAVRAKCASRLNIIKILAHSSWKLSARTLTNIYRALIGSLIDYCASHHSLLARTTLQKLQCIQNAAVRAIYRLPVDTPADVLNSISGLGAVGGRLRYLCNQHLCSAVKHNNELINSLISEFIESYNSIASNCSQLTPLCAFLGDIT